jgi:hypothetical protein
LQADSTQATGIKWAAPAAVAIGNTITSATQGSIFYAGAAGVLAQDNTNFFFENSTYRSLRIATTTSAWGASQNSVEIGGTPFLIGQNTSGLLHLGANLYFDGTNYKYKANGFACDHYMLSGEYVWRNTTSGTAGNNITWTDRMKLDVNGNLGIGASPANAGLEVQKFVLSGGVNYSGRFSDGTTSSFKIGHAASYVQLWADTAIRFFESSAEVMRSESGAFMINETTRHSTGGVNGQLSVKASAASTWALDLLGAQTTGSKRGLGISYDTSPNGASDEFIYAKDSTTARFVVNSNGGISNFSANNVNLSDLRTKKDIVPADPYLTKINAIKVVKYKYKDQTHDDYNLGVIAQQLHSVCPEFVNVDGFGETPEDGIPLMSVYEADLKFGMLKAIQELSAQNAALLARIEALEARI